MTRASSSTHPPRLRGWLIRLWLGAALGCLSACGASSDPGAGGTLDGVQRLESPPLPLNLDDIAIEWVEELERRQGLASAEPDSARAWLDLGMGYEKCAMRELAVRCYEQAQLRDATDPKSFYRSGICHWRLGAFEPALRDLARAVELEPGYAPSYYRKGIIEMDAGDFESAWSSFEKGAEVGPDYQGNWIGQARLLLQRDQPQGALDILEPMAERDPFDAKVNNLLVTALRQAGKPSERERLETTILGDTPDPAWGDPWQLEMARVEVTGIKNELRALLRSEGQAERALELILEHKREAPDDWSLVELHAEALFQLERVPEAVQLYREYLVLEPEDVAAHLKLSYYHEADGAPIEAVRWLDEVLLRLDAKNPEAWTSKGRILCMGQQYEFALPVLEQARTLDPSSTQVIYWLIQTRLGLLQWKESLPLFRLYVAREPEDADVWLDFARARVKIRSYKKAEEALERAVQLGVGRTKMVEQVRGLIERRKQAVKRKQENEQQ